MYCKPRGRENTMSKDLFTISLLIAGSVSWVGAGSVSYCYEGLDRKGFWIEKALKQGRSLGGGGGGSIYMYNLGLGFRVQGNPITQNFPCFRAPRQSSV